MSSAHVARTWQPTRHPEVLVAFVANLEGWAAGTSGHPSRRRADARLRKMAVLPVAAELTLMKPPHAGGARRKPSANQFSM